MRTLWFYYYEIFRLLKSDFLSYKICSSNHMMFVRRWWYLKTEAIPSMIFMLTKKNYSSSFPPSHTKNKEIVSRQLSEKFKCRMDYYFFFFSVFWFSVLFLQLFFFSSHHLKYKKTIVDTTINKWQWVGSVKTLNFYELWELTNTIKLWWQWPSAIYKTIHNFLSSMYRSS